MIGGLIAHDARTGGMYRLNSAISISNTTSAESIPCRRTPMGL